MYSNEELIAITKELTESLRASRTVDWEKKESARAGMRRMIKRLLKKYKYPPEGMEDAIQTVISQCEMWADYEYSSEHASESVAKRAMTYFDAMSGKN